MLSHLGSKKKKAFQVVVVLVVLWVLFCVSVIFVCFYFLLTCYGR